MKRYLPGFVLGGLLILTLSSIFGEQSYPQLQQLRQSLNKQITKNEKMSSYLQELRQEVIDLQHNDRVLEKTARNELGLAREDELIFIFEKEDNEQSQTN